MNAVEGKIVYFVNKGEENTDDVLNIVRQRAEDLGIKSIVIASSRGVTAAKAVSVFQNQKVVVVTWPSGYPEPNTQPFTDENRKIVESKGGVILTCGSPFGGLSNAMQKKFKTSTIGDIVRGTLRIFGQGTKVCCEIAMMAADSGLVGTDEEIIAVAGTGRGADTALLMKTVISPDFFDFKIKEILCKPHF